jgi:WLM domain
MLMHVHAGVSLDSQVLFHELAHNEHSDHDDKFYMLMRQVFTIAHNCCESNTHKSALCTCIASVSIVNNVIFDNDVMCTAQLN